jgi:two-component system sensor kinase FixL
MPRAIARFLHGILHFLLGVVALTLLTWLCFWLGFGLVAATFPYLTFIVLVSLVSNVIVSLVLSLVAAACLNYFFSPPVFSFRFIFPEDIAVLVSFLVAAWVFITLVKIWVR